MSPLDLRDAQFQRQVRDEGWRLTRHAIDRIVEMKVPVPALLEILRDGNSVPLRSSRSGRTGQVHSHPGHPWAVVRSTEDPQVIVTVLFHTYERYERDGDTFHPVA